MTRSELFFDRSRNDATFIADYHHRTEQSVPQAHALKRHRIHLALVESIEWQAWRTHNGKQMPQEAFAEFLENRAGEIVQPSAAQILEVASSMHATRTATFGRGQRLQNGDVQFTWREETTARAGDAGTVEIPAEFVVELQPWQLDETVRLRALFRYRISPEGKLALYFVFAPDPTEILQQLLDTIVQGAATELATPLNYAAIP